MNADKAANTFTSEPTRHDTQDRSQTPVPTPDGTSALSGDLETVVSAEAVERATSRPGSPQIKGGIIGVAPTEAPSERYAAKMTVSHRLMELQAEIKPIQPVLHPSVTLGLPLRQLQTRNKA